MENKRTRISAMLLVLALLLSVFGITAYAQEEAAPAAAVCYVPGDVNSDGSLDSRDAIYTLYASMGYENYSVSQDCDFDGDGEVQVKDAIWLLYASLDMRNHELPEEHHDYHDPIWNWDGETAALTLACGCGNVSEPIAAEVTAVETEATCTEPGFITYTATAEGYTDVKVVYGDAVAGHEIGEPTCGEAAKCANCDFEIPASGHSYVKNESLSTAATCQAPAKEVWECSVCGDSKEIDVGEPVKHQFEVTGNQELAIGQCQYAQDKTYTCTFGCGVTKTERTEVYTVHNYVRTTTAEPTCIAEGVTTYTCEGCGDTYTEAIPVASEHAWTYGSTVAICRHCGAEKAIVKMGSEGLAPEEITSSEIVLENNASVTLDDATLESIEESLVLEVNDVTDSFTNSTDKEIAAVYDLNMYVDGQQVSQFAGEITVSLPYTLQPGDDVNCIDIYYIDDSGNMTQMQGTYAGGYVTFTTSHFSYYTICITPYCERFGHQESAIEVEATCEEGGYHLVSCNICGMSYIHVEEGMGPKGHRYDELNIEGHCTEDIYYTQYCLECGAPNDIFVPAIGHNMILDEELSVAATCEAPGKEVYYCDHIVNDPADPFLTTNCGYSYEVETARLSHEYESVELVQACVSGGGTQYTCKHCSDTYIENATAPTGHAYKLLDMSWNETKTLVTASLGCENCDWTHTQQAVITRKITAPTCSAPGVITYTAKTVYNMIPFQVSVDVPVEAIDHIPGGELQSNAGQHYYSCIMCGEPVGGQNHSWGETSVVTEPTCVDAGEGSQACTVCGYEKTITIPATGEHSYKDGKCTVCGFEEGSCSHVRTYETPIDLAEMGGCEGTIHVISCECGYQTQAGWDVSCNLVPDEYPLYVEDQYGFGYFVYVSRCADCGLTIEYAEYATDYDPDTCTGWNKMIYKITLGDTVLVDGQWHDALTQALSGRVHPTRATGNTVDLREYGLCQVMYEYVCPCGQETAYYVEDQNLACDWHYDEENSTENVRVYNCSICGAVNYDAYDGSVDTENCLRLENWTTSIYTRDGEKVFEATSTDYIINHSYQLDRYELYGDSCTDGISTWYSCENCGVTRESYTTYHALIHEEVTELSGVCYETAVQRTCPCEEQRTSYFFQGENRCSFYPDHYDAMTETWTYDCDNCGAILTEQTEFLGKDENCVVHSRITAALSDKDGNLLFTGTQDYEEESHNSEYTYELLGNSCQDGVKISQICKDCGYGYSYTTYGHEYLRVAEYDMSAFGFCSSHIYLNRCACGEEISLPGMYNCDWNRIDEDDNEDGSHYVKWYCPNCQTYRTDTTVYGTGINTCQTRITTTHTFEKEGVEPFSFTFDAIENNHKYIYELTLRQEGTTCHEGYHVYGECQVCGAVDEWDGWSENHPSFTIAREIVTENLPEGQKLCGELEVITDACPCGQYNSQHTEWVGGSCQWDNERWNEELGEWLQVCSLCGAEWYEHGEFTLNEGETCEGTYTNEHVFYRNGQEILRFQESWASSWHKAVYTFEKQGETCEDGFYAYGRCITCGQEMDTEMGWSCYDNYHTNIQIVEHQDICGTITTYTEGCACTPVKDTYINCICDFDWYDWDETTGSNIYKCGSCGLLRYESYGETITSEDDPCRMEQPVRHEYVLKGETIGVIEYLEVQESHDHIYDFDMQGDTCEDGYYLTERCANCDYSWTDSDIRYGHEQFLVEYYDLSDYGMCGGDLGHQVCPCGQEESWPCSIYCDYQWTGEYDDETKLEYAYCEGCGSTFCQDTLGGTDENCLFSGEFFFKLIQEDEEKLNLRGTVSYESHDTYGADAILHNPEGSCEEGVTITFRCRNCDYSYTNEYYSHKRYEQAYYDLAELMGACEGSYARVYSCACGYSNSSTHWSPCEWSQDDSWTDTIDGVEHEYTRYVCRNCDLTLLEDSVYEYPEGSCEYFEHMTRTFSKDGYDPVSYERSWTYDNHQWQETVELMPGSETCEDGIYVHSLCTVCGETMNGEDYWCRTALSHTIDFSEYGACGGIGYQYSCACGRVTEYGYDGMVCDFDYVRDYSYEDPNGNTHYCEEYQCSVCGLIRRHESWNQPLTEDSCYWSHISQYIFTMGENTFGALTDSYVWENHSSEFSISMRGDTCEDGVDVSSVCSICGEGESYTTYSHNLDLLPATAYSMPNGSCGGEITVNSCPCGLEQYSYDSHGCDFMWDRGWSETIDGVEHGYGQYTCSKCGLVQVIDSWQTQYSGCTWLDRNLYTYTLNGEEVLSYETANAFNRHNNEITYELLGETCADGVIRTYACTDCDYSYTSTQYGCSMDTVATYELPDGSCGGTVTFSACPCGNMSSVHENYDCSFDSYLESESYGSYGYNAYSCPTCGTIRQYDWNVEDLGNCQQKTIRTYTYSRKEQDDVVVTTTRLESNHDYQRTYELLTPGTSCEDGILVTERCINCGCTNTWENYGHDWDWEYLYMPEDTCGGYVQYYSCPCGYATDWYSYLNCDFVYQSTDLVTDEDGPDYNISYYSCSCGLSYAHKYYTEYPETCKVVEHNTYTYYLNDVMVGECTYINTSYTHEYVNTGARLLDGSTTCEDGVEITETCTICGHSSTYTSHNHTHAIVDGSHIDLAEYCGCDEHGVYQTSCACGENLGILWDGSVSRSSLTGSTSQDDDGIYHYLVHYKLNYCDVYYWHEEYSIPNDDGTATKYQEYRFTYSAPAEDDISLGTIYCKSTS